MLSVGVTDKDWLSRKQQCYYKNRGGAAFSRVPMCDGMPACISAKIAKITASSISKSLETPVNEIVELRINITD